MVRRRARNLTHTLSPSLIHVYTFSTKNMNHMSSYRHKYQYTHEWFGIVHETSHTLSPSLIHIYTNAARKTWITCRYIDTNINIHINDLATCTKLLSLSLSHSYIHIQHGKYELYVTTLNYIWTQLFSGMHMRTHIHSFSLSLSNTHRHAHTHTHTLPPSLSLTNMHTHMTLMKLTICYYANMESSVCLSVSPLHIKHTHNWTHT